MFLIFDPFIYLRIYEWGNKPIKYCQWLFFNERNKRAQLRRSIFEKVRWGS